MVALGNRPTGFGCSHFSFDFTSPLFCSAPKYHIVILYSLKPSSRIRLLIAKRIFQISQASAFIQTNSPGRKRDGVISSGYLIFSLPEPLYCERWSDCANSFCFVMLTYWVQKYISLFIFLIFYYLFSGKKEFSLYISGVCLFKAL